MKVQCSLILVFLSLTINHSFSQTYLGLGYAGGNIETELSSLDEASGVSVSLIREIKLGESRWRLDPTLNMAFLFSKIDRNISAFYTTMTSISPVVSFEIIQKKRLFLAPSLGPYANWVITKGGDYSYYNSATSQFIYESYFVNEVKFGFEFGLSANILIGDNFSMKIVPLNYQVSWFKDEYDPNGFSYFLKFTSSILIRL